MTGELIRFQQAQADSAAGYAAALRELQTTGKLGHWIWYIFPQLSGLGSSSQARRYAIQGRQEALEYLRDPVLGPRLLASTQAVLQRLKSGMSLQELMGSELDVLKLISSLTLFEAVSRDQRSPQPDASGEDFAEVARQLLAMAEARGYERCARTLTLLRDQA